MIQCIPFEPGDATRYTILIGLTDGDSPRFVFGFGVGDYYGIWTAWPVYDIPDFSFEYFREKTSKHTGSNGYHTDQLAFSVFLHILGRDRFATDPWSRERDMKPGYLDGIPTLKEMMEV